MGTLHIDLQEGFTGEEVAVRLDGREVYRRAGVLTNYSIGLAGRVEAAVPDGPVAVRVELPARGAAAELTTEVAGEGHLAVSLDPAGRITITRLDGPARYL